MAVSDTHALVAETDDGRRLRLAGYPTYDHALAAHRQAESTVAEFPKVRRYAVRSSDDREWTRVADFPSWYFDPRAVDRAVSAWVRQEIGATALAIVAAAPEGTSLVKVCLDVRESLAMRGFTVSAWEVEEAVKSRVLLGRCHKAPERYGGGGGCRAHGYWARKGEARLADLRCPHCGRPLGQSTLALGAGFRRIAA